MAQHISDRLSAPGPKRMLALDGGGTRGVISIEFLREIEKTIQKKLGRGDDFVLADYFDMIGGTSVGSILATMLALGWRVNDIDSTFKSWAPQVFKRRTSFNDRYDARALSLKVRQVVHDWPLKSEELKTGLCVVAKRADTNSAWIMTNNPNGRYFEGEGATIANGDYLLHDVIRASTAAPTVFSPKQIEIHAWHQGGVRTAKAGYFMDGALSPHNNPAWAMYMLAVLKAHNLGGAPVASLKQDRANGKSWGLGPDQLMMISIGTGSYASAVRPSIFRVFEAIEALRSMIHDGEQQTLANLQGLSQPRMCWTVDSEIGDMASDLIADSPQLSFQRYDMPLEANWLKGETGNNVQPGENLKSEIAKQKLRIDRRIRRLQELVNLKAMKTLQPLARAAAQDQVSVQDFPDAFDQIWQSHSSA